MSIFKRKTYKYTNSYISANNEGVISIKTDMPFSGDIKHLISETLKYNGIYDDAIYVQLYKEYTKKYQVYDNIPLLLLYKIPILFYIVYRNKRTIKIPKAYAIYINSNQIGLNLIVDNIPTELRVPPTIVHDLSQLYYKIQPFMDKNLSLFVGNVHKDIECLIESLWLQQWETSFKSGKDLDKNIRGFYNIVLDMYLRSGSTDNKFVIKNVIERYLSKNTNKD